MLKKANNEKSYDFFTTFAEYLVILNPKTHLTQQKVIMKKSLIFIAALAAGAMVISSCSSSKESAYRKAYEKAKAQEKAQQSQQPYQQPQQYEQPAQQPQVTPLVEAPAQQPPYNDNATVRSESVSLVSGSGIRDYSVVVGSFGVQANAEALRQRLNNSGYQSQVVRGNSNGRDMYRVILSTSDTREGAVQSRNSVRSTYPDAWILKKQ